MTWAAVSRGNPEARALADRHYNRQKPGALQFAPPGRCLILLDRAVPALWITSWPYARFVKHRWAGAWVCSAFRKEGPGRASDMIRSAIAATRTFYGDPPAQGMVTFIDRKQVRPTMVRGIPTWGWTWAKAGFEHVGETGGGLMCLQLPLDRFPAPLPVPGIEPHRDFRPAGQGHRDLLQLRWASIP